MFGRTGGSAPFAAKRGKLTRTTESSKIRNVVIPCSKWPHKSVHAAAAENRESLMTAVSYARGTQTIAARDNVSPKNAQPRRSDGPSADQGRIVEQNAVSVKAPRGRETKGQRGSEPVSDTKRRGRPSRRQTRRQSHGSAWHWKQTDSWYYTLSGTKKRIPLFDEDGVRIRGRENK